MMSDSEKEEFDRIAGQLQGDVPSWPASKRRSWQRHAATWMLLFCAVGVPVSFFLQGVAAAVLALVGVVAAYLWRLTCPEPDDVPGAARKKGVYARAEERWRKRQEGEKP